MARPPIHPGEILADELGEIGVTPTELSRRLRVPANRISQIIQGKRAITGDTALRLGHWFGTSGQFWINLQSSFDLRIAAAGKAGKAVKALPRRALPSPPQINNGQGRFSKRGGKRLSTSGAAGRG